MKNKFSYLFCFEPKTFFLFNKLYRYMKNVHRHTFDLFETQTYVGLFEIIVIDVT